MSDKPAEEAKKVLSVAKSMQDEINEILSSPKDLGEDYLKALRDIPPEEYREMIEGRWEAEQPPPTPGRRAVSPVAREMFEGILEQQEAKGLKKYGTRLETFNGRNAILDAMAEVVDTFQYLTQAYMEQQEQKLRPPPLHFVRQEREDPCVGGKE